MENLCVWSDVGKLRHGLPLVAVLRSTLNMWKIVLCLSAIQENHSSCQRANSQCFPPSSTSTQFKVFWVLITLISGKNLHSRGSARICQTLQVSSLGC